MRVGVFTSDIYLFRKIEIILSGRGAVAVLMDEGGLRKRASAEGRLDLALVDVATGELPSLGVPTVTMGRRGGELRIPFTREELIERVFGGKPRAELTLAGRTALLHGREIRLTEVEAALLSRLLDAGGEFVERDELHRSVWQDADGGVLNVYIHYLREKLEGEGEKIIISSRKLGYKIDAKYLGGRTENA